MMQNPSCGSCQRGQMGRGMMNYGQSQMQPRTAPPCPQARNMENARMQQPENREMARMQQSGNREMARMQQPGNREMARTQESRNTESSSGCSQMSKEQLYRRITLTGFALVDTTLYLDTHPDDREAIRYFQENSRLYQEALAEYSEKYGPLTLSHAHHNDEYWDWVNQPWPWQ